MLNVGSGSSACGIAVDGLAYCWGGKLGDVSADTVHYFSTVPIPVGGGASLTYLTLGNGYACGLTADSLAYCWGYEGEGGLGDGHALPRDDSRRYANFPSPVAGGLRFTSISAGFRTTCALDANGRAYCWGFNEDGQVGDGTTTNRSAPTPVLGGYVFREVQSGGSISCGITTDGQTMCWGRGLEGELGNGTTSERSLRPVRVIDPSPERGSR
jgi:alpha-tubulin suppressor-like RCC1 family protein